MIKLKNNLPNLISDKDKIQYATQQLDEIQFKNEIMNQNFEKMKEIVDSYKKEKINSFQIKSLKKANDQKHVKDDPLLLPTSLDMHNFPRNNSHREHTNNDYINQKINQNKNDPIKESNLNYSQQKSRFDLITKDKFNYNLLNNTQDSLNDRSKSMTYLNENDNFKVMYQIVKDKNYHRLNFENSQQKIDKKLELDKIKRDLIISKNEDLQKQNLINKNELRYQNQNINSRFKHF